MSTALMLDIGAVILAALGYVLIKFGDSKGNNVLIVMGIFMIFIAFILLTFSI